MDSVLTKLRRRQLNRWQPNRERIFGNAIRRFIDRRVGARLPMFALTDAEYGWGNETWAADEDYLARLISEAEVARGTIVECGSGLSTILLAAIVRQTGAQLHSLEHNAEWQQRVSATCAAFGLANNTVHYAPLQNYGEFDWYTVPDSLPADISLVVCDGPPSDTRGGRYGVLPLLAGKLTSECKVLLDDANRPPEQAILSRWETEFNTTWERRDTARGFARVVVGSPATSRPAAS